MVTPAPTCFCTVWKFCRSADSETSAHVGRVATRLTISAVVATLAIIAGGAGVPTLRRGYAREHHLETDVSAHVRKAASAVKPKGRGGFPLRAPLHDHLSTIISLRGRNSP